MITVNWQALVLSLRRTHTLAEISGLIGGALSISALSELGSGESREPKALAGLRLYDLAKKIERKKRSSTMGDEP